MTPQQYKLIELEDLLPKVNKFEELKEELEDFEREQFTKQQRDVFKIEYITIDNNGKEFTIEAEPYFSWGLSGFLVNPGEFIENELQKHKEWINGRKQQRIAQAKRDLENAQKYLDELLHND